MKAAEHAAEKLGERLGERVVERVAERAGERVGERVVERAGAHAVHAFVCAHCDTGCDGTLWLGPWRQRLPWRVHTCIMSDWDRIDMHHTVSVCWPYMRSVPAGPLDGLPEIVAIALEWQLQSCCIG